MLAAAQNYGHILKSLFWSIAYDERYKYYVGSCMDDYIVSDSTWNSHEFVSLNQKGEVIGYIKYSTAQRTNSVSRLAIVNFDLDNNSIAFARDVYEAINNIFCKYNFDRLSHSVFEGNPAQKTYEKLHKRYGGRTIGTFTNECRLITGELVNETYFEITRENYLKHRRK